MKIILIGYMGSGKSTVGKLLAEKLQYSFYDLDSVIEEIENDSISNLFGSKGEIYFRKKENEMLKKLISKNENFVMATGGGTPCYGDSLVYMLEQKDTLVVYLNASLEILCDRLYVEKENRPLISHLESKIDLNDFLRKHLFERSYYYNQAEVKVASNDDSAELVVEKIIEKLY